MTTPLVRAAPAGRTQTSERSARWPVDDLGPAGVLFLRLATGHDAVVVLDNLTLGPAIGGLRMTPTVDAVEVVRLARAMTIKSAAAGLPHGGGKAGVVADLGLNPALRERVVRAFAVAIGDIVDYVPGPDMGTDETAMAWIRDEIGRAVGLPAVLGGIPLDQLGATGFGLAICAEALHEAGRLDLDVATVVVQGFGSVGRNAALQLHQRGAKVIAVSDSRGAVYDRTGLDIPALVAYKREHPVHEFPGGRPVPRDAVLGLECDVLVPAAQPDVLHMGNADAVRAKVILQGANIPATAEAEERFRQRDILSVPDVVANAGGVICASVEYRGGDRTAAFEAIEQKLRDNTGELLERVRDGRPPRRAAEEMAMARIAVARAYRRRL